MKPAEVPAMLLPSDDYPQGSIRAKRWIQGSIRRRAGQKRDEVPRRDRDTLAGWDAADAFYAEMARDSTPAVKPAEVLVLSVDDREAWIRGHVDLAAAQSAVEAVDDRWLVTYLAHVRGHYGLGVNEAGESVKGRLYLDPTRTGPGWFPVTIATLRRVRLDE